MFVIAWLKLKRKRGRANFTLNFSGQIYVQKDLINRNFSHIMGYGPRDGDLGLNEWCKIDTVKMLNTLMGVVFEFIFFNIYAK